MKTTSAYKRVLILTDKQTGKDTAYSSVVALVKENVELAHLKNAIRHKIIRKKTFFENDAIKVVRLPINEEN